MQTNGPYWMLDLRIHGPCTMDVHDPSACCMIYRAARHYSVIVFCARKLAESFLFRASRLAGWLAGRLLMPSDEN